MQLFGTNGVQLPSSSLAFELNSVASPLVAAACNDGNLSTICHSLDDATLTIHYSCECAALACEVSLAVVVRGPP